MTHLLLIYLRLVFHLGTSCHYIIQEVTGQGEVALGVSVLRFLDQRTEMLG